MRYTLIHMSDLHAGPPFMQEVAASAARQAHEIRPDLLVVSGDLVQRADLFYQWPRIKTYLSTLPQPQLVVPGNHDVPLLDVVSRIFAPLRYYKRHISSDVNPVFKRPGLLVVGGSSAHGLTVDGGYVTSEQQAALKQSLSAGDAAACRVAVLHHPVVDPPAGKRGSRITNAHTVLELFQRHNVELFLCGHVHFSYIDMLSGEAALPPGALAAERQGIIICQCGTTTSRRGRGTDRRKNSFNVIEIDEQTIRIHPHFYAPAEQRFLPLTERVFNRQRLHDQRHMASNV